MTLQNVYTRRDTYADVTTRIIEALEQGVRPWSRPWSTSGDNVSIQGMPHNASTGKPYRGVNVMLLTLAGHSYTSHAWLTFKQAKSLGGSVRKGEHGTAIVFWKRLEVRAEQSASDDDEEPERNVRFLLRSYTVFNVEQCEGLKLPKRETVERPAPVPGEYDGFFDTIPATVKHGGDRAAYAPLLDLIMLPHREAFESLEAYYATRAHELVHWTGHTSRLNREFGKRFGDSAYAFEELVAEMGAAFLCSTLGLPYQDQHADYVGHWLKVLKQDNRAIFAAASKAQAAADLLLKLGAGAEDEDQGEDEDLAEAA